MSERRMLTWRDDDELFSVRVAGVAIDKDRVLLHRAAADKYWALPGGRCEFGEPARDALVREMREELKASVIVERLLWTVENFFGGTFEWPERVHELGLYFLMRFDQDSPIGNHDDEFEGDEGGAPMTFRWWPLADLDEIVVKPDFLREGLPAMPLEPAYVVNRVRPSMLEGNPTR